MSTEQSKTKRTVMSVLMMALLGNVVGACVDTTPITVTKAKLSPGDAGPADADDWPYPACRACIAAPNVPGPGCADQLAAAAAVPLGMELYDCAYLKGCVTKPTRNEALSCALVCADELGLVGVFDPAVQRGLDLTACFDTACGDVCKIGP